MAKYVLDMTAMQDDFFGEAAMIGIVSAAPAYRLCWLINEHFGIGFEREPELDIVTGKKNNSYCFPIYQYLLPNSEHKYLLYKLKNGKEVLLPETKQLDYLWLLQTGDPEEDARHISGQLRNLRDIQMATIIDADQLKNILNLLI